jgi:hypothetical protein
MREGHMVYELPCAIGVLTFDGHIIATRSSLHPRCHDLKCPLACDDVTPVALLGHNIAWQRCPVKPRSPVIRLLRLSHSEIISHTGCRRNRMIE